MSSPAFKLLRLMGDARLRSGTELANAAGMSRAELARALAELESLGVELRKVRGRGYGLVETHDWLAVDALRALLGEEASSFRFELLDVCTSTNTLLLERARAGAPSGSAIACELQSAGRGRRGNNWHSTLGGSLTFSLLWRFATGAAVLSGLSLAAGVAVARALESVGVEGVELKWPNDLLHAGRKLGGMLIELQGPAAGPCAAVLGIGLNLRLRPELRAAIAQPVTDIAAVAAKRIGRNQLLAAALRELAAVLALFAEQGFAPLRAEWMSRHAHQGKPVRLTAGEGQSISGEAIGVAEDGALLLATPRGVERFLNGELSLRGA